jgi:hypothetical protein
LILCDAIVNKTGIVAREAKDHLKQAITISEDCPANQCSLSSVSILMSKLIVREFVTNPAERSSIEDIFNEVENYDFKILPGIDSTAVRAFSE